MASSSCSRAATPSGCADAAQGVFSIAALFSTAGPGPWCILPSVPSESDDLRESHLASRRQFIMSATRYRKRFDSISYGSGISLVIVQLQGNAGVRKTSTKAPLMNYKWHLGFWRDCDGTAYANGRLNGPDYAG